MDLMLSFPPQQNRLQIKHGEEVILLGSCFADSMRTHFVKHGFKVLSNPFGTLFHPLSIANSIEAAILNDTSVAVHKRDDIYFSWNSSSKVYGMSEEELRENLLQSRQNLKERLSSAKILVITFGTSWGYNHQDLNTIVANCHKEHQDVFKKELSSSSQMYERWTKTVSLLHDFNPELEILFSVSPVRHLKDGLIENNRSKGRLLELSHELCDLNRVGYFPSYELILDQLRDYRFYKEDLIHPNAAAIEFVWDFFMRSYFSEDTRALANKVRNINTSLNHDQLHPDSIQSKRHLEKTNTVRCDIEEKYPMVYWE